jgi:putative FmdB family regulatory protein
MPIYEFFCDDCNTIFNFFSRGINTTKRPPCPRCNKKLARQMSAFAVTGRAREDDLPGDLPMNESKMERAMQMLAGEAERIDEDNPKQAADLMRKLSNMTGLNLGDGMQEALRRMERGEDPEQIEAEMGDILESEDPFQLAAKKGGRGAKKGAPMRDETLYDL